MEISQRNIIRQLKPKLVSSIDQIPLLLDALEAKQGLAEPTVAKIRSISDSKDQIRHILDSIVKRPSFDIFYESLIESQNGHVADMLRPELAEDRKFKEAMEKRRVHVTPSSSIRSYGDPVKTETKLPPPPRKDSIPTSPSVQCSEDIDKRSFSEDGPDPDWSAYTIKVFPVETTQMEDIYNSQKMCYKVKSKPRGRAVILSNTDFPPNILKKSFNRDADMLSLEYLLQPLGFDIVKWHNCSKEELFRNLNTEASNPVHEAGDIFMMFILTHGTDDGLYMTDGEIVPLMEIVKCFTTSRCRYLLQKPKLFFIQACQGKNKDYGEVVADADPEPPAAINENPLNSLPPQQPVPCSDQTVTDASSDDTQTGDFADILVSTASTPGYGSWSRSNQKGTWYIQTLTEVFSKKACEEDLLSMLTMVHYLVSKLRTKSRAIQTPSICLNTLQKKVYFFPGL